MHKILGLILQPMSSRLTQKRALSSKSLHVKIQGIFIIKGNSPTTPVCVCVRFFGRFLSGLLCCRWIEVDRAAAAQALKHYARRGAQVQQSAAD